MNDLSLAAIAGLSAFLVSLLVKNDRNSEQRVEGIPSDGNAVQRVEGKTGGGRNVTMYYDQIPKRLEYQRGQKSKNIHVGQLKLFLGELEFLTDYLNKNTDPIILVYAGSAPCNHASVLTKMFPNLKIIMIDPTEHYIMYPDKKTMYSPEHIEDTVFFKFTKGNRYRHSGKRTIQLFNGDKVIKVDRDNTVSIKIPKGKTLVDFVLSSDFKYYVIEDYFTTELAQILCKKNLGKFLFCSDIRTNIHDVEGLFAEESPSDLDILWNSAMQFNWLHEMEPMASMLKFRCPFFNPKDKRTHEEYMKHPDFRQKDFDIATKLGIDFLADYSEGKFIYYKPKEIYLQSFAGATSAETRLVVEDTSKLQQFDCREYEEKLYYYNTVQRPQADPALMHEIFRNYYSKYFGNADASRIEKDIAELLVVIQRKLG